MLNCGMGDASQNSKGLEAAIKNMSLISGQRPVKTKARQAIASFKLREGQTVGIMVTLRGKVRFPLVLVSLIFFLASFMCSLDFLNIEVEGSHLDLHPFCSGFLVSWKLESCLVGYCFLTFLFYTKLVLVIVVGNYLEAGKHSLLMLIFNF